MNARYDVFISYRHKDLDSQWANWLVRALETYRPPRSLAAELRAAGRPDRIRKVFRDEDETAAGGALTERIKDALNDSRSLVVICSRDTPGSTWVEREIEYFESLGRADMVLPFLVDGEPLESFPQAIRQHDVTGGVTTGFAPAATATDFEPLAADARPRKGLSQREVRRRALLKITAGALGVKYDDLYQRDRRRRRKRQAVATGVAVAALAVSGAWTAWTRTDRYQVQRVLATAPQLLPSSIDDQLAQWCRALVLTGRFDEAQLAAQNADTFAGKRVKALVATAEATRSLGNASEADRLMHAALNATQGFQPGFATEIRLTVAKSFVRQKKMAEMHGTIADAIKASAGIEDLAERVTALRSLADFLTMADGEHLLEVVRSSDDAAVTSTFANAAIVDAARRNGTDEARRLTAVALAAAERADAMHRPFLIASVIATAASAGTWTGDAGALNRTVTAARALPTVNGRAGALHQAAVAMAGAGQLRDARALLVEIADNEERHQAAQAVARTLARAGDLQGIEAILREYATDDGLDRFSVISDIAEGAAEGRQAAMLEAFVTSMEAGERAEVYVKASETWRASGAAVAEDPFLEKARETLNADPQADDDDLMSRLSGEFLARGRLDDALLTARAAADPHSRAFALLAIAQHHITAGRADAARPLLAEATSNEEKVSEPDLRAAGYREIGRALLANGDRAAAVAHWQRAVTEATANGEYGSSTVADVAENYARLGELRTARLLADTYCGDDDRLRVYTTILLQSHGLPTAPEEEN